MNSIPLISHSPHTVHNEWTKHETARLQIVPILSSFYYYDVLLHEYTPTFDLLNFPMYNEYPIVCASYSAVSVISEGKNSVRCSFQTENNRLVPRYKRERFVLDPMCGQFEKDIWIKHNAKVSKSYFRCPKREFVLTKSGEIQLFMLDGPNARVHWRSEGTNVFVDMAVSYRCVTAIKDTGELMSFGYSFHGIRGLAVRNCDSPHSFVSQLETLDIDPSLRFVQLDAGQFHTVALTTDGQLYAWGRNNRGQCGAKAPKAILTPTLIQNLPPILSIACGKYWTFAVTKSKELLMWGRVVRNQPEEEMIDGKLVHCSEPRLVPLPNSETIQQFTSGKLYIAVMTDQRNIYLRSYSTSFRKAQKFPYKTEYLGNGWIKVITDKQIGQISAGFNCLTFTELLDPYLTASDLAADFAYLRKFSADIKLKYKDRTFHAIQGLLAVSSPLLFKIIESNTEECIDLTDVVPDMTDGLFDRLLDYIHYSIIPERHHRKLQETIRLLGIEIDRDNNLRQMFTTDPERARVLGCDLKLQINKEEIFVHRYMLTKRSSYFKLMFKSGFQESIDNTVVIADTDPAIMTKIVEYLYTGKVFGITEGNAVDLMVTAAQFSEPQVQLQAEAVIARMIDSDNVQQVYDLARRYKSKFLIKRCQYFVKTTFATLHLTLDN